MGDDLPGTLVVLSGPSGVGKTTVAQRLVDRGGYVRSVSVTTRQRREGEVDGLDYRFITHAEFEQLQADGELVESAEVHGKLYGTPKEPVRQALRRHMACLLVIDVYGGQQVRGHGYDSLLVFLAPPDQSELAKRLAQRGTEDYAQQTRRLQRVEMEVRLAAEIPYNHLVVNDNLERCVAEVHQHVQEHRRRLQERKAAGQTLYPGLEMDTA